MYYTITRGLFVLFCFLNLTVLSQESYRDSVKKVHAEGRRDTVAVSLLNKYSRELFYTGEYDAALSSAKAADSLSDVLNYPRGKALANKNIGNVFFERSDFTSALTHYLLALKINENLGDRLEVAKCNNNIGGIYKAQDMLDKALEYHHRTRTELELLGDSFNLAKSCNNIGDIYSDLGQRDTAYRYYYRALTINEIIGDSIGLGLSYMNIGQYNARIENYERALEYYFRSLDVRRAIGDVQGMATSYAFISEMFGSMHKYRESKIYADSCLILSKELGDISLENQCYALLAQAYGNTGDYKSAYEFHKLYKELSDSIYNIQVGEQLGDLKTNYEVEKKASELKIKNEAEKKRIEAINDEEKKQQTIIIISVVIVLMLVGVFAFVLFKRLQVTQKQKRTIEEQKKLVEEQKHLVDEKQKEIIDSINYAKRIQGAILATEEDIRKLLPDSFLLYQPKDIVAGDFYFFECTDTHIFYAAADCTGHGVPGALVSVVCSNALSRCVKEFALTDPGNILDNARELVLDTFRKSGQDVKDGMDISFLTINRRTGKILWAGANNPLWYSRNGQMTEIKANKQPVGLSDNPASFVSHEIPNEPGTIIYLFTDGYADQFGGPKGKKYKYKQLEEKLIEISTHPLTLQKEKLHESFEEWRGELEQVDDVCVIGIKI